MHVKPHHLLHGAPPGSARPFRTSMYCQALSTSTICTAQPCLCTSMQYCSITPPYLPIQPILRIAQPLSTSTLCPALSIPPPEPLYTSMYCPALSTPPPPHSTPVYNYVLCSPVYINVLSSLF